MTDTRLACLLADFNLVQTRLAGSIARKADIATRVTLMRRATALMDRIECHDPATPDERLCMIGFFMGRTRYDRRALSLAMELVRSPGHRQRMSGPCQSRSTLPHEVLERLASRGVPRHILSRHIAAMPHRVSLLDRSFRHICTSKGNSRFHQRARTLFEGLHIADLEGPEHYASLTRRHLHRTLNGRATSYYHPLNVPALGMRVMQCVMRPWRSRPGRNDGIVVWMNDVTDIVTRARGFGIPAALTAGRLCQSIDGTT